MNKKQHLHESFMRYDPAMNELTEALQRFDGNAVALARAIDVSAGRVRIWKFRGYVPEPWPQILRRAKPKKSTGAKK